MPKGVTNTMKQNCSDCNGTGRYISCFENEPCQRCEGSGREPNKDGPAVEHSNNGTEWYQNIMFHKPDGPAKR